jgi:hypothetical protein
MHATAASRTWQTQFRQCSRPCRGLELLHVRLFMLHLRQPRDGRPDRNPTIQLDSTLPTDRTDITHANQASPAHKSSCWLNVESKETCGTWARVSLRRPQRRPPMTHCVAIGSIPLIEHADLTQPFKCSWRKCAAFSATIRQTLDDARHWRMHAAGAPIRLAWGAPASSPRHVAAHRRKVLARVRPRLPPLARLHSTCVPVLRRWRAQRVATSTSGPS